MSAPHTFGNWAEVRKEMQKRWDRLSDAELDRIDGDLATAVWRLQEVYGLARDRAERALDDWYRTL